MSLTVVIPAIPEHVVCLEPLLEAFCAGPERPDQVIVSLSQAPHAAESDLVHLQRFADERFEEFLLLRHDGRMLHGPNRQAATPHIRHDLVMYQDADDLPHPQRVAVAKTFFHQYDIMHLNHACFGMDTPAADYISGVAPIQGVACDAFYKVNFPNDLLDECVTFQPFYGMCSGYLIHAGMPIIRKEVLSKVSWKHPLDFVLKRSEDYEFNMESLFYFKKTMLINAELVRYSKYQHAVDAIAAFKDSRPAEA